MIEVETKKLNLVYDEFFKAYPDDADALISLCHHGLEKPLGFDHTFIVQDLIGKKINQTDFDNILIAYVALTAYYFLLDAVVDGHLKNKLQALYLTHFLSLACNKIDEIIYTNPHIDSKDFNLVFYKLVSENAKSIRYESEYSSNPLVFSEKNEYESIVGRSNSSIVLLEIIATIAEVKNIEDYKGILRDFAFFVQLGDDLADWSDDLKSKNYTSFLREIFSKHKRILTEPELEEEIYLSTIFELRSLKIIKGLEEIIKQIESKNKQNGVFLKLLIFNQIESIKVLMTQVIEIKLNAKFANK